MENSLESKIKRLEKVARLLHILEMKDLIEIESLYDEKVHDNNLKKLVNDQNVVKKSNVIQQDVKIDGDTQKDVKKIAEDEKDEIPTKNEKNEKPIKDPYIYQKRYYAKNKEREQERNRAYSREHVKNNPEYYKNYYATHREQMCANSRNTYYRNKAKKQLAKYEELKKLFGTQNEIIDKLIEKKYI